MKKNLYAILITAITFLFFSCNDQNSENEVLNTDLTGKYSIYRLENGTEVLNENQYLNIVKNENNYVLNRHTLNSDFLEHSINLQIEKDTIFYENDPKRTTYLHQDDDVLYVYFEKKLIGKYKKN